MRAGALDLDDVIEASKDLWWDKYYRELWERKDELPLTEEIYTRGWQDAFEFLSTITIKNSEFHKEDKNNAD